MTTCRPALSHSLNFRFAHGSEERFTPPPHVSVRCVGSAAVLLVEFYKRSTCSVLPKNNEEKVVVFFFCSLFVFVNSAAMQFNICPLCSVCTCPAFLFVKCF